MKSQEYEATSLPKFKLKIYYILGVGMERSRLEITNTSASIKDSRSSRVRILRASLVKIQFGFWF